MHKHYKSRNKFFFKISRGSLGELMSGRGASVALTPDSVFVRMVARAKEHGYTHAGEGCEPGKCSSARHVPVQIRENVVTGERRLAWMLEKPQWKKSEYKVVKRFTCFYSCQKFHLHHCSAGTCDSAERGHVVESATGDKVCGVSGRVLEVGTTYDWKERKKGAYTARTVRRPDPNFSLSQSDIAQHNANDWKMMRTAASVVHDCLFSKLRHELFANTRRTRKRTLESKVVQYAKRCKRQRKFVYVAEFNKIAIESGFFSNANYETISRAQDPKNTTRALAPLLVSLFKTLNGNKPTPLFKSFPVFAVSALYTTMRGVNVHGVQVIPAIKNVDKLLPHPNAIEGFFRFLWAFYSDAHPTQRNFLTKTQNTMKAALCKLTNAEEARLFCRHSEAVAEDLRQKYYDLVEKDLNRY